jgi:DNA polymerase
MKLQVEYLKKDIHKLQKIYGNAELKSIYGAGCISNPEILFLFMNPTARNISSLPNWKGIRAPWIGTKNIWKLFYSLGILSFDRFSAIQKNGYEIWTEEFSEDIYDSLNKKFVYVTNLAKCTQDDARALKNVVFKSYLRNTKEEIYVVNPKKIISFGNQVSSILLDRNIKVSEYKKREKEIMNINDKTFDVYPVYYPIGQGLRNINKAIRRIKEILSET